MQYFVLRYRLKLQDRYLIWISNDTDRLFLDTNGLIPSFRDTISLQDYATSRGLRLQNNEPIIHDLDWVASWIRGPKQPIDSVKALVAWNLFTDVARSIEDLKNMAEYLNAEPRLYRKLFLANNLPSVTPKGQLYTPKWTGQEIASLAKILSVGLGTLERSIQIVEQ